MSICLLLFLFYIYKSDNLKITLMLNKKLNVTCWNNCVIKIMIEWYKLQIIKSTPRIFTNIIFTFVKKYNLLVYSLINESRFSIFKLERVHNCSNMAHVLGLQQMLIKTLDFSSLFLNELVHRFHYWGENWKGLSKIMSRNKKVMISFHGYNVVSRFMFLIVSWT